MIRNSFIFECDACKNETTVRRDLGNECKMVSILPMLPETREGEWIMTAGRGSTQKYLLCPECARKCEDAIKGIDDVVCKIRTDTENKIRGEREKKNDKH